MASEAPHSLDRSVYLAVPDRMADFTSNQTQCRAAAVALQSDRW